VAFAAAATVSLALGAPLALAALIGGIAGFAAKYLGGFADVAGGGVMGQNIASRLGTAGMIGLSIAEAAWMAAAAWGLSTLMAGFSLAREYVTVSRWGRPGLQTGDWVMLGRKNFLNYILSCKWQPGLGNRFASFA